MELLVDRGTKGDTSTPQGTRTITVSTLQREYLKNKLTSYEIASKYGCSAVWVNHLRKKFKIHSLKPYQRNKGQKLSSIQKQCVYGGLLGDDCLKKPTVGHNAYLVISQNKTQEKYVIFKYSLMLDFVKSGIKFYKDKRKDRKGQFSFKTISHPVFTKIYERVYGSNKKTICTEWLQQLTPLSLAIWFMDDGSITRSTRMMRISTESFGKNELFLLKEFLNNKWNISPRIISSPKKGKLLLSFPASERDKFFSIIRPFVIPEMSYKLCRQSKWRKWTISEIKFLRQNYKGWYKSWHKLSVLNHSREAIARKASYLNLGTNHL